jgi:hypothetical protein
LCKIFGEAKNRSYIHPVNKKIKVMITYIIIGASFMFLIEAFVNAYSKNLEELGEKNTSFDWFTRIFTILFWPYQIYILVEGLFNHKD